MGLPGFKPAISIKIVQNIITQEDKTKYILLFQLLLLYTKNELVKIKIRSMNIKKNIKQKNHIKCSI